MLNVSKHLNDEDLSRIRAICSQFPEAEEGRLQDRPLFHVRRRRFAIFNGDDAPFRRRWQNSGRSLHFMTDVGCRVSLQSDGRFTPSPHHGFRGWMALNLHRGDVPWTEIEALLETAYRAVTTKELIAELDRDRAAGR